MRIHLLLCLAFVITMSVEIAHTQTAFSVTLPPDSITQTSALLQGFYISHDTILQADFDIRKNEKYDITPDLNFNQGRNYTTYTTKTAGDTVYVYCLLKYLIPNSQYCYRLRLHIKHRPTFLYAGYQQFTTLIDTTAGGFIIPINIESNGLRGFGVHTHASECIDQLLGEMDIAPFPPAGAPELRFIAPYSYLNACYGEGFYVDLRQYSSSVQIDTFKLKFQRSNNANSNIVTWGNPGNQYTGEVRLLYPLDGSIVNTDMKAQLSDTLPVDIDNFYIVAEGPTNLLSAWYSDVSRNNITLRGTFNPGGLPTEAWFEWDSTKEYRKETPHQDIGSSTNPITFISFVTDLDPNALYNYRVVTKQGADISYGIDQYFSINFITSVFNEPSIANTISLSQNYPNPFNPSTTFSFTLGNSAFVSLKVFTMLGEQIAIIVNEKLPAGTYNKIWNANGLPSGVYFYKLETQNHVETRKLIIIK